MYLGRLCFITDPLLSDLSFEDMTRKVLKGGFRWIQYRDKFRTRREIYEEALRLRKLTKDFNGVFIVNDYVDIAFCTNADGVHLGQNDLPIKEARKIMGKKKIIGISTHNLEQAINAEKEGADYIGFGPVFKTTTKDAGEPKGTEILKDVKKRVKIPVVAIGGINLENIMSVLTTGVDAIAIASAILKGDIDRNIKEFLEILLNYGKQKRA
ncbi:MAG: thiamine phosphate synthase [Nitrospirae bacterium]|nr:thiamine phosphate synthase [Nitrospirota bacterium]